MTDINAYGEGSYGAGTYGSIGKSNLDRALDLIVAIKIKLDELQNVVIQSRINESLSATKPSA